MRYLKKKNYEGSIRKVVSDDKTNIYGVFGTVGDLLSEGILTYCDYERDVWAYIERGGKGCFAETKEEIIAYIEK